MPTILLVDDEALLRRAFRVLLETTGYRVIEAGTAAEAIASALSVRPALVVLDLGLPDRPGLEVARELARDERTRGTRIVALTGRSGEEVEQACTDAGCAGHLVKPVAPKDLLARVQAWLETPPTTAPAESPA